jgi:hypothetical protein
VEDGAVPRAQRFTTTLVDAGRGRVFVPVPFDPDATWGAKARHHVHGTIGRHDFRGVVEEHALGRGVVLGPAWCRDRDMAAGAPVDVAMDAEGVQRDDLAPDLAAALAAAPDAGAFFDGLAQFYRTAYVQWIEATKRRPEVRAERIAEVVRLLQAGVKQRPRT